MSIIEKLSSGVTEAGNTITQKAKGISEQTKLSGEEKNTSKNWVSLIISRREQEKRPILAN